jgi:glutamate synthase domain-containing protein 3
MDLTPLITPPPPAKVDGPRRFFAPAEIQRTRSALGDRLLADAYRAIWDGDDVELEYPITNADRTVGAALAGSLALEYGTEVPRGKVSVRFTGSAGQSFAAFLGHGIEFTLVGEANDYVGKGMAGGRVVIRPGDGTAADPVLAGNTCLYGATGGELFLAGSAGERFAVRNSGATAVVEGVGDHACEYMTGGTVVVLGPVGYNVGAGMTGGQVFVWDPDGDLNARLNSALVEAIRPDAWQVRELRWLVEQHHGLTESARAAKLLADWAELERHVWVVLPIDRVRRIEAQQAGRVAASA